MSRTDELRGRGATDRTGGGGGAPFVKWGDTYEWIEGRVESVWQTQYGAAVEMTVTNSSPNVRTSGKDEDGNSYQGTVRQGEEVNVGLNNKMLEGTISPEDVGGHFHVAFEGWQEPERAGANRYRVFTVLEVPPSGDRAKPGQNVPSSGEVRDAANRGEYAESTNDDDLPF